MDNQAGATVRIIFYVLSQTGASTRYFSVDVLLNQLQNLRKSKKHSAKIDSLLKFRKNCGSKLPDAFTKEGKMRPWLKKHHNGKPRFWFDLKGDLFRFKPSEIATLKKLIK